MKLLLTSSGITNKSISKSLSKLLGKPFKKAKLVFVPTAANVEEGDKQWLIDDLYNFKKLGFSEIDIVDISAVGKKIWLPAFEKANILVFGGGNVSYLLSWLRKTGLNEILPKMLAKKVYVGISAGSMVAAKNISLAWTDILYYEKTGKLNSSPGLGLVNFEIRPHFNSKWFPKVTSSFLTKMAKQIPNTFYGIDDATAIEVMGDKVSVISEGRWEKFN